MKGKNKFILMLFAVITLVATGVVFAFGDTAKKIAYAQASTVDGFSAEIDGGVIFSAERVYTATTSESRQQALKDYNGYEFQSIATNNGVEYFADYRLYNQTIAGDYSHKDVVKDGEFVMADSVASHTVEPDVEEGVDARDIVLTQAIMVTVGGYYHKGNSIVTNAPVLTDVDGVETLVDVGANIQFVAVQATLDGKSLTLPSARTYNSEYQDFTWFIPVTEGNEGHYEIVVSYMVGGKTLLYEFDFYLLLKSSYEDPITVSGNSYEARPTMENATLDNSSATLLEYSFESGTTFNYPTLTFDYTRYKLSYVHVSGDVQKTVDVEYQEENQRLVLTTSVYGDKEEKYYSTKDFTNSIITLMFVDNGRYSFDINYIYKNNATDIVVNKENLSFEKIVLNIYGYQLKYSKSGFMGADMTYLEIAENGTQFILVNGFIDSRKETVGDMLGVNYSLVNSTEATGTVLYDTSVSASIAESSDLDDILSAGYDPVDRIYDIDAFMGKVQFPQTDRGLWLTLNDSYYLATGDSYYYYSASTPITAEYIANTDNRIQFNKVTTFTAPGYYLLQVKYLYETKDATGASTDVIRTQYFAFQITSATPVLELYKTEENNYSADIESTPFYAYEYTNQNVYAYWEPTQVFESKVTGRLYYSTNNSYPSESDLKSASNGYPVSNVASMEYNKNTLLYQSGSYLLVLEVENSATKIYTYFTIDNDPITGLEVYEVDTKSVDNKAVYSIKTNSNLNYITHTSKGIIDSNFTLGWNNKNSGAPIMAKYKYTPFIKTGEKGETQLKNQEKYLINDYGIGSTSKSIEINKPTSLNSALNVDNVLTDQGIYEFTLIDSAGNILEYIVIVDRTEAIVNATYGEEQVQYRSGQTVAEYVELEWGTHKAIDLDSITSDTIVDNLLSNSYNDANYYVQGGNLKAIKNLFTVVNGKRLFAVQNTHIEIKEYNYQTNSTYRFTSNNNKEVVRPNGVVSTGWDEWASSVFTSHINSLTGAMKFADGIRINVDTGIRSYTVSVVGINQVTTEIKPNINVVITPDTAQGSVYSASEEKSLYETSVRAVGESTEYQEIDGKTQIYIENYGNAQASDDGVFVFEWLVPSATDNFKVTEVRYDYYQLMDQATLNSINKDSFATDANGNYINYLYYPYQYVNTSYILQTEGDDITVKQYNEVERVNKDNNGNVIETKKVYQSNPLNIGYETYYDNGQLSSKKVTQTGLYIITRSLSIQNDAGEYEAPTELSYVFFVDRNSIIGYSISNINDKIVGQFIHASMPTSEGEIHYDNFTKQGLTEKTNELTGISYKVYLETNKLPTQIKVPSGKYVTGKYSDVADEIYATSYNNLNLKLSIYFEDVFGLLPDTSRWSFIKLAEDLTSNSSGYISLKFDDTSSEVVKYRNARIHTDENSLSVPGVYVFVIGDNVGKVLKNQQVVDYNEFTFGVKLTNQAPELDVYAYAQVGDITGDKVYADDSMELHTNQEFVDFEILIEDLKSYNAQLDISSVEVVRTSNGSSKVWLKLYKQGTSFAVDPSGIVQDFTMQGKPIIVGVNASGNYVSVDSLDVVKYVIKLDTGLKLDASGQIESYEEYSYSINIEYILANSGVQYYTYKDYSSNPSGVTCSFYGSTYTVNIDRSPNTINLNNLLKVQGTYFNNYHDWLADQTNVQDISKLNTEFAYRNTATLGDYYGLSNSLYYYFVENDEYYNASKSMYAMTVNANTVFDTKDVEAVYYRKLKFDSTLDASTRMGLLPVCDTYFGNSTGFYTFNENLTEYKTRSLSDSTYAYWEIVYLGMEEQYKNSYGEYVEIVEKDKAGNYTQYVIYFIPENTQDVTLNIEGKNITDEGSDTETIMTFKSNSIEQKAFIGIDDVNSVNNLAGLYPESTAEIKHYYQYYGNINIYNVNGLKIKTIYLNSTSTHPELEQEIAEVITEQGNFTIEYIDVYGKKYSMGINNYLSDNENNKLNTSSLSVKTDANNRKYIEFSGVNTRIDGNTWWFATKVQIEYDSTTLIYDATFKNGVTTLTLSADSPSKEVWGEVELSTEFGDRLNLINDKQYTIILTDVAGKKTVVTLSTSDTFYPSRFEDLPDNRYESNNIIYTSTDIKISYNTDFYEAVVEVYINDETTAVADSSIYYNHGLINNSYGLLTLLADVPSNALTSGSLRRFEVKLNLKTSGEDDDIDFGNNSIIYNVWIDTRSTEFKIENVNKVDQSEHVKSTFKNIDDDYNIMGLIDGVYYNTLITETVNITWKQLTSDYFTYTYDLYEFVTANQYNKLTMGNEDSYSLVPKEDTTGRYILKVTIKSKNNTWIASRVFGIYMSTTITGLYEVTDKDNNAVDSYSALTDLQKIMDTIGRNNLANNALSLGFADSTSLEMAFKSFGYKTAIPMYIAKNNIISATDSNYVPALTLHSNKDNGVDEGHYVYQTEFALITLYHIHRPNYRTFVVIMEVYDAGTNLNILSQFAFKTNDDTESQNLLQSGTSKVIYDKNADYYRLIFNSYNQNNGSNALERQNKIIIDVYYNNKFAKRIIGGDSTDGTTYIDFKNSGTYTLYVSDLAGNIQYFRTSALRADCFTIVVMKDVLYTINGEAPIKYAFYDKPVELQINRSNPTTGVNNYDINTIRLTVNLNGNANYKGYDHPAESSRYIFKDYGTYLITIKANLLSTGEEISSQIVFTILNPNEARTALDFTSIYGYNIISVFSITNTTERNVTDKFMDLLQDKSNTGSVEVYNKLVTYERLIEVFGSATQGKMKFRVVYEVDDDDLLPARTAEFSFTINNEKATINSSIKAGGKTTKAVTLKFNPANIYDLIGDCNLVINGQVVLRINASSANSVTEVRVSDIGEYYVQLVGDSGNVATSFNFTIKEPLNTVSIILIIIVSAMVIALIGTFIWLRTRMKVR